jgi:hypothetical protein
VETSGWLTKVYRIDSALSSVIDKLPASIGRHLKTFIGSRYSQCYWNYYCDTSIPTDSSCSSLARWFHRMFGLNCALWTDAKDIGEATCGTTSEKAVETVRCTIQYIAW